MRRRKQFIALTIAGSDSGGGAGVQTDLKTFAALGVHGTTAITCITAQNPREVRAVQALGPRMVAHQIEVLFEELPPAAVKTGMLHSAAIIREVACFFGSVESPPLVVDPVMVATSGARLLKPSAVKALKNELLPAATLVTPNLDETEVLLGWRPRDVDDLCEAALELAGACGCAVLIKGGHLRGSRKAVDVFCDGVVLMRLEAPFIRGVSTHGTGCTYSAAITAHLARGASLPEAVRSGKEFISAAIRHSLLVGKHTVLNPLFDR